MRHTARPTGSRAPLRRSVTLTVLAAALAAAAGCSKPTQGLVNAPPPEGALAPIAMAAPLVDAPTPGALPAAPPARFAHVATRPQSYAFADRAYAMSTAFSDAPPDYTYYYGGVRPWVWRSYDGSECIAEAVPGGERIYYYEPGADEPFFVEDPDYGYGFEDGELVSVYDSYGQELADAQGQAQAEWAGRYLARAQALYAASLGAQRYAVAEPNWQSQRGYFTAQNQAWGRQVAQNPDWQAYHQQYYPAEQAHFAPERQQRLAWAARVDQTNHNPAAAQRELAAAQRQQPQLAAQRAPQPAFARQPELGRQQVLAQQQAMARQLALAQRQAQGRQQAFAQQQALARQQAFAAQRQRQARQQAFAARQSANQAQASRFAQQRAEQQQATRLAAQRSAQQQAMAREAANTRAEAGRRAQLMAQQRQQAGRAAAVQREAAAQQARFAAQRAAQQGATRQAAMDRAESQRRVQMVAQQQSRAMAVQRQAAAQQAARASAERAQQQAAGRAAAQQRQAAQANARDAQQRTAQAAAAQARAHASQQAAAAAARHPPKKG